VARRSRNSTHTSFEHAHAVLEHGICRVSHTSIDIALFGPGELAGTVGSIGEIVRTRLVKWERSGSIDWVRLLSSMECKRLELGYSSKKSAIAVQRGKPLSTS